MLSAGNANPSQYLVPSLFAFDFLDLLRAEDQHAVLEPTHLTRRRHARTRLRSRTGGWLFLLVSEGNTQAIQDGNWDSTHNQHQCNENRGWSFLLGKVFTGSHLWLLFFFFFLSYKVDMLEQVKNSYCEINFNNIRMSKIYWLKLLFFFLLLLFVSLLQLLVVDILLLWRLN